MLPSPDISVFDFSVLFDLSVPAPVVTITNQSTGDHLNLTNYIFKLVSPNGLVIYEGSFTSPDATGAWTTFQIPNSLPLVKGAIEWGMEGFVLTGTVKDSLDTEYPVSKTRDICRPSGNTTRTTNNYGSMQLLVETRCADAKIYVEEKTNYLYQGITGTDNSKSLTLIYPQNSRDPFYYGSSFSNLYIKIFQDGEPYQIDAQCIRDYGFDNGTIVRFKYKFIDSFAVLCSIDLCCLQTGALAMANAIATASCSDDLPAKLLQVNSKLTAIQTAKLQPKCNIDIYQLMRDIKDLLGDYYDCGSCNTGIPDLSGGPVSLPTPLVYAGEDQQINLPTNTATLNGQATESGGTIVATSWALQAGPQGADITIGNPTGLNTSVVFNNSVPGTYVFKLTATDGVGRIGTDSIAVSVLGQILVDAGTDQALTLPANLTSLVGSASVGGGIISLIQWTQVSGPNSAIISTPSQLQTDISGLIAGSYIFRLSVKDNTGRSASDTVTITVSLPSISVNAGTDQTITLPVISTSVSAVGVGTRLSYVWTKISGPSGGTIVNGTSANAQINSLQLGVYVFRVTVTDLYNQTAHDDITITVQNPALNANAGTDQLIVLPTVTTTLNGTGSTGNGLTYAWTQVSGPGCTIATPTTATTVISGLAAGTYVFRLTITDNASQTAHDDVTITVVGMPIVNAGIDQTITLPTNAVSLAGTAASANATITSVQWTQVSGPNTAVFTSPTNLNTNATGLIQGTYVFRLTAFDNYSHTGNDTMTVIVNPASIVQFTAFWGWADAPFTTVVPTISKTGNTDNGDGTFTEVWQIGSPIVVGAKYHLIIYSHDIIVTTLISDTPTAIAARFRDAINATSESSWNDHGGAPAHGTAGFPPTATASGDSVHIIRNAANTFAGNVDNFTNALTFSWQGSGLFNTNAPIVADYRTSGANKYLGLKYVNTETDKVSYFNTPLNNGAIPDANFLAEINTGGNKYILSRIQLTFDPSATTTFS